MAHTGGDNCQCLQHQIGRAIRNFYRSRGSVFPQTGAVVIDSFNCLQDLALCADEIVSLAPIQIQPDVKKFMHTCIDLAYQGRQALKSLDELPTDRARAN